MEKLDHVKASIGGKEMTFRIERRDLSLFEATAGEPAYAVFRALQSGAWTVTHIRDVLRFALLEGLERWRSVGSLGVGVTYGPYGADSEFVDKLLAKEPPALYAPLAMLVLGAALFGIEAEDAVFSDETVGAA